LRKRNAVVVNDVDVHVAGRVRLRRSVLGLTLAQLAAHLGVSWQQLAKYERGSDRIGASRLYVLACVLGVPVDYFFEGLRLDVTSGTDATAPEWRALLPTDNREQEVVYKLVSFYWRIKSPDRRRQVLELLHALAE
jgi:transcriptional regulator with XRE-family HTH domain